MRRIITVMALAATMLLASASMAMAGPSENAECAIWANHGEHIVGYVAAGTAAGGGAAHFGPHGVGPGASFCQGDNSAPELLGNPGRFA
jgi:hypothetical protein